MRIALALSSAVLLAACATSQPAPAAIEVKATGVPGQAAAERTVRAKATITAIDGATRAITVKGEDGQSETFTAPPEMKRFGELAVGDVIEVELLQGLLLEYQPAGTEAVEPHAAAVGGRAPASEAVGAAAAAGVQGTVTVVAIDPKTRLVTFQGPAGRQSQVKAGPKIQLEKLKVGDRLLATYVESVAVQVVKGGEKL